MVHFITGGSGTGKSTALIKALGAYLPDATARVLTLVPEQYAFTYEKRLYAALGAGGFNSVFAGTFRSLTGRILEESSEQALDVASDVAREVTLYRVLREEAPKLKILKGARSGGTGLLRQLASEIESFIRSGTAPAQIQQMSGETTGMLSGKLEDFSKIYERYLTKLGELGVRDTRSDTVRAAKILHEHAEEIPPALYFFDEFDYFQEDEYALLEEILPHAEEVYITLRTDGEEPEAGYGRFAVTEGTLRRLTRFLDERHLPWERRALEQPVRFESPSLSHLSRYILTDHTPAFEGQSDVTIVTAPNTTLESDYTAAKIRALMEEGARGEDIMVLMHDPHSYGPLLQTAFERYEIPYFLDLHRPPLHTAVMRAPLCVLSLLHRTTTDDVLTLLKTSLTELSDDEAARLENYAYEWDIEGKAWERPIPENTDPKGQFEPMRVRLLGPILRAREEIPKRKTDGAFLCELLYDCLSGMGVPKRVSALAARMNREGDVEGGRAVRRLYERFTELLDAARDATEGVEMTVLELKAILEAVLELDEIPVPPQKLGTVTVQSAAAARYEAPKYVFVLGCNEGVFPANAESGGFFTESERVQLAERGLKISGTIKELGDMERLTAAKTLSCASKQLFVGVPRATESGDSLAESPLIEEIRALLPGTPEIRAEECGVSFYVRTKAAAYDCLTRDYEATETELATVRAYLESNPEEHGRLERLRTLKDPQALRVESKLMKRLTGSEMQVSATQIENTAKCPFMGFLRHGMRIQPPQKHDLDRLQTGNFIHKQLETLFKTKSREEFLSLTPKQLKDFTEETAQKYLEENFGGDAWRSERFLAQYKRLTESLARLLDHTQKEMSQSKFYPDACELVIGIPHEGSEEDEKIAPYTLTLPNGVQMFLNGKIDRVDTCTVDGRSAIRIVDYKTGAKTFDLGDIYYGLNLQMLLYLFALLEDKNMYPDAEPAGVLYAPAGAPSPVRKDEEKDLDTDEYINKHFRMKGILIRDRALLSCMEERIEGVYIPAKLAEDDIKCTDEKTTQILTPAQLQNLRGYVEDLLCEKMGSYLEGNVAPSPLQTKSGSGKSLPCDYCDYADICGASGDAYARAWDNDAAKNKMDAVLNMEAKSN